MLNTASPLLRGADVAFEDGRNFLQQSARPIGFLQERDAFRIVQRGDGILAVVPARQNDV